MAYNNIKFVNEDQPPEGSQRIEYGNGYGTE